MWVVRSGPTFGPLGRSGSGHFPSLAPVADWDGRIALFPLAGLFPSGDSGSLGCVLPQMRPMVCPFSK